MGAAAELAGPVADGDDAHLVAVLLAEQRHRPDLARLLLGHHLGVHGEVLREHRVDLGLDVAQHAGRQRPRCAWKSNRKRPGAFSEPAWVAVSPNASRIALCTMWVAVCARLIAWRRSMSTSELAADPTSTCPEIDPGPVHDQALDRRLHVVHLDDRAVGELDPAGVGQLAAALGVERRAVQHELDLVTLGGRAHRLAVDEQPRPPGPRRRPRRSR